ncbi:MAG: hypothetical protein WC506_00885 [Candidatus Micrarchaeia archaeon]
MAFGLDFNKPAEKEVPTGIDICIISGERVTEKRYKVKDDAIISSIRNVKNKFGLGTNNRLYVSPENYEAYKKKRSKFEQKVVLLGAFGVIVSLFVIGANLLMRGTFDLVQVLSSIALTVFLVALAFVDYVPAVEDLKGGKAQAGAQTSAEPAPSSAAPAMEAPEKKPAKPARKAAKGKKRKRK